MKNNIKTVNKGKGKLISLLIVVFYILLEISLH